MSTPRLPSLRVCETAREFIDAWSAEERADFFALVARATDLDLTVEKIEQAVASTGNIARAAALLGCSRRTLQLHMRRLGMPKSRGGRPAHRARSGPPSRA